MSVPIFEPGDFSGSDFVFGHHQIIATVPVDIGNYTARGEWIGILRIAERNGMLRPRTAIRVLEPFVGSRDVEIAISIDITDRHTGVNGYADVVPFPRLPGIRRNAVAPKIIPVGHGDYLQPSIAVEIAGDEVMNSGELRVENEALEWLLTGRARIAIPDAAGDMIDPSIAIHVDRRATDVGRVVGSQYVPRPTVRALIFKPIDSLLGVFASSDEIKIAVVVEVDEAALAIRVARQVPFDKMMGKLQLPRAR
jgi:hypothetical protein